MSFIDDMKIGKKLIGGFLIVVIILGIVAAFGYTTAQSASVRSNEMYQNSLIPISQLGDVQADFQQMRAELYRYIYVPASRAAAETTIADLRTNIKKNIDTYRAGTLSPEEKTGLAQFDTSYAAFNTQYDTTVTNADKNDVKAIDAALTAGSPLINARTSAVTAYKALIVTNEEKAKKLADQTAADAAAASLYLAILTIAGIVIALVVAFTLTRGITGPVEKVSTNLKELSKGHLGNRLKMNRKDEIGEMAGVMDQFSDDLQNKVVAVMKNIANGDLSVNVQCMDSQDEIGPALITITTSLRDLVTETNNLSKSAIEGKLSVRGNADKFKGGYHDIVAGINKTLDGVVEPLNEAMRISNEYARGDFTARVDEKLNVQGDFVKFKQALNNIGIEVSKALASINEQIGNLAASAEEANASVEEVSAGAGQMAKSTGSVSLNVEKSMQGVEQVQKAMEDLSRTVQEVATRADVTSKLVHDTTTYSKEGMDLAKMTEKGMQGITKSSNEVNGIIVDIKGQMDQISEIVNLITDLANQTNLLALNAAIEAARAGDAGRGFAVVATEVKSLAIESRSSAEKIAEMIRNLQDKTNTAVSAVNKSTDGVQQGSEALQDTLNSFTKIVNAIEEVSKNITDVAAAAEEQAASVEEITASMNEVNGLMVNTSKESTDAAAASEESAAAIEQITQVVGNVNTIVNNVTKEVSKFKC